MTDVEKKLQEMGLALPDSPPPVANYVPFVRSGALLFVSGQISIDSDGNLITGKLGAELDVEAGAAAAPALRIVAAGPGARRLRRRFRTSGSRCETCGIREFNA